MFQEGTAGEWVVGDVRVLQKDRVVLLLLISWCGGCGGVSVEEDSVGCIFERMQER